MLFKTFNAKRFRKRKIVTGRFIRSLGWSWKLPKLRPKAIGHLRITVSLFFKASRCAHSFIWKLVFICTWMKTNFHMKGWAPGLALKKRPKVIRKWPIERILSAQHKPHPLPFGSYFTQEITDHAQNISKPLIFTTIFMLNRWTFVKLNEQFSTLL